MNKLPITVGIVGHLDSIVTKEHTEVIEEIFNDISSAYPNSPIALFTQLAKGADTQVARIFCNLKEKKKRDYRLIVPLPFEVEKYKKEFDDNELMVFNDLRSKAASTFVLKSNAKMLDDDLYRQGGKFVADSAVILIALWDKDVNGKTGGTSDIVNYLQEGSFHDEVVDNIFDQIKKIIELPCNRSLPSVQNRIKLERDYFSSLIAKDESIKKALEEIEKFNIRQHKLKPDSVKNNTNLLFPETVSISNGNKKLKEIFGQMDFTAVYYQTRYRSVIIRLFFLGIISFSFFEYYKEFGEYGSVLAAFLILLGFGLGFIFTEHSKLKKVHQKYIDSRFLAEALRVQFYWNLDGQTRAVSEDILRIHKKEFDWARHLLSSIFGLSYTQSTNQEKLQDLIVKHWVKDQKKYFSNKISFLENRKKIFKNTSIFLFIISMLLFLVIVYLKFIKIDIVIPKQLIIADTIVFGLAVLLRAYYNKMGYEQISNQYELMYRIYDTSEDRIIKISENENLTKEEISNQISRILKLTGKEALVENGNWYMVYKDKEPEIEGLS